MFHKPALWYFGISVTPHGFQSMENVAVIWEIYINFIIIILIIIIMIIDIASNVTITITIMITISVTIIIVEQLRRQTTMLVSCSQCFWKGCIHLLHICIFSFFSFQRKFNNHLKILTTTIWSTISRFYHCYFILRWNVLFSRFYFQLVNDESDFIFPFCKMFGRMAIKKPSFKFSILPTFF